MEQNQFEAESGAHGRKDGAAAGLAGLVLESVREHAKHRGGGEIADLPKGFPAKGERIFGKIEGFFGCFEDLGTAGVEDPGADVGEGEGVLGEEAFDVAADVLEHDLGDVGREDDAEAGITDIPAHDVLGVAVEGAAGGEDIWGAGGRFWQLDVVSGEHDRGAAIAEEAGRDKVGDGLVVVLPGERTELDREQKRTLVGEGAEVVRGARDAGGPGDAAQPEDGRPLDVRGERHQVDEAGVDGRRSDAGDGGEEDSRDVCGGEAERREGALDSLLAEGDSGLDPEIVGLLEAAAQLGILLDGQDKVAGVDAAISVQTGQNARLRHLVAPALDQRFGYFRLCVTMARKRSSYRSDVHAVL